jgi:hypothetical protein
LIGSNHRVLQFFFVLLAHFSNSTARFDCSLWTCHSGTLLSSVHDIAKNSRKYDKSKHWEPSQPYKLSLQYYSHRKNLYIRLQSAKIEYFENLQAAMEMQYHVIVEAMEQPVCVREFKDVVTIAAQLSVNENLEDAEEWFSLEFAGLMQELSTLRTRLNALVQNAEIFEKERLPRMKRGYQFETGRLRISDSEKVTITAILYDSEFDEEYKSIRSECSRLESLCNIKIAENQACILGFCEFEKANRFSAMFQARQQANKTKKTFDSMFEARQTHQANAAATARSAGAVLNASAQHGTSDPEPTGYREGRLEFGDEDEDD